jgi:DNA-binding CsgD family transcriptional regulator
MAVWVKSQYENLRKVGQHCMGENRELIEFVLDLFCYKWKQSATIFDTDGNVLLKISGNVIFDELDGRISDQYRDRALALIRCFGDILKPTVIHSTLTFFPCYIFCPILKNNFYLITGYFVDLTSVDFLLNIDLYTHLIDALPKYNLDEQQRMIKDLDNTSQIVNRLISTNTDRSNIDQFDILSTRERQILNMIRKGMTNADIAKELFISENTVKSHVSRLFKKLGITRRRDILNR